ncbi:MAG: ABC transporter permease subunit [Christensenellaceae bacterium]|jgi:ABC-type transport system involved in multi-copper enzyme maturation permease subunit|nr:ABC transporter permease subunit [Christensenellaceae bacterium]
MLFYELKKLLRRVPPLAILYFIFLVGVFSIAVVSLIHDKEEKDYSKEYTELRYIIVNETNPQNIKVFHEAFKKMNASVITGGLETARAAARSAYENLTEIEKRVFDKVNSNLTDYFNEPTDRNLSILNANWEKFNLAEELNAIEKKILTMEQRTELLAIDNYELLDAKYRLFLNKNNDNKYLLPNDRLEAERIEAVYEKYGHGETAFRFGEVNSFYDFIFNCMEIASIPLIILAIIFTAGSVWTDIHKGTIITSLAIKRKRGQILLAKFFASLIAVTAVIGLLFALFYIFAGQYFDMDGTDKIIFIEGAKTPADMFAMNYLLIYILSLLFKIVVFMIGTGLFCLSKRQPKTVIGSSAAAAVALILFSCFFTSIPLDPIKYLGTRLMLSPLTVYHDIWWTFPIFLMFMIVASWQLFYNFKKKDF